MGKKVRGNKNFKKEGMLGKGVAPLKKGGMWPSSALCILKQYFKRRYLLLHEGVIKIDWKGYKFKKQENRSKINSTSQYWALNSVTHRIKEIYEITKNAEK